MTLVSNLQETTVPKHQPKPLKLAPEEIRAAFADPHWANQYPPILSTEQVAQLLQKPVHTIHQMSSQGQFAKCAKKVGKHLRFFRDRLIEVIFNDL